EEPDLRAAPPARAHLPAPGIEEAPHRPEGAVRGIGKCQQTRWVIGPPTMQSNPSRAAASATPDTRMRPHPARRPGGGVRSSSPGVAVSVRALTAAPV